MTSPLRLCVHRAPAPGAEGTATVVTLRIPSEVSYVEEAVELVTRHCLAGHEASGHTRFRLRVVLAEALTNAIVRGNREDRAKWVHVRAELRPDTIRVSVTDEGPGFDPGAVPEPVAPGRLDEPGGRGLFLIRRLVDAVQFNEQGNSISMILRRQDNDEAARHDHLRRELELAHDLQLKLLPSPAVLHGDAEVAARCFPANSVGGDFYTFIRLGRGRVGVMLGDVASHGFSAALMMAMVMSAAGIHAAASMTPDETLAALLDSLSNELATTELFFSVFYGVLDPYTGRLTYANAGHPHAFRVPRAGAPERLEATSPPLGLAPPESIQRRQVPWHMGSDLLCLWTDGLVDARNDAGERFGERRLLDEIGARRTEPAETIVQAVLARAEAFGARPTDDRTLLVLRM